MAHCCLDVSLPPDVSAFAAVLVAAMTAASVDARRYLMAQITVVGSKCWIVMASCSRGLKAKNGCYCKIRSAVKGRRTEVRRRERCVISLAGDELPRIS